jgi:Mce-associated membrane protein
VAVAAAALVLVVLTVVALVQGLDSDAAAADGGGLPTERRVADARGAAEAAVVPVLSYDYRTLDEDQAEAKTYLTDDYAQEYERFFAAAVTTNAPRTQTVVRVRVLESAIVRTGQDRVDVLLFVNRPTTNKQRSVEYRDQVTMRMLDVDGTWLVDCLITTNSGPCERD